MKKGKKTILLNWGYHRKSWVEPFNHLKDHFRWVYLFHVHPQPDEVSHVVDERIYWSDFKSAGELLDRVAPDKVVFMSLESGLGIALNTAAKQRRIPTSILQHGLFTTYQDYRARERLWKKNDRPKEVAKVKEQVGFSSFRFLLNSLRPIDLPKLLKFPLFHYLSRREGYYYAAKKVVFPARKPVEYICYTPKNATIHRELDRAKEEQFIYTGNPEMDDYLLPINAPRPEQPYFLHIDQALAENSFGEETVSIEDMVQFYLKLNRYCEGKGAKLKVKLHPESYESTWLPQSDNIEWIRDNDDMPRLIQQATGCFGFYSTLVLPAIYWGPTVLFRSSDSDLQNTVASMGVVELLDFYTFQPSEITFAKEGGKSEEFIRDYFYSDDRQSLLRLKNALAHS